MVLSAFATAAQAQGQGGSAEIEVEWHEDNMGFNVTSSKDISNVIVETCPEEGERQAHKHEDVFEEEDIKEWSHEENETVVAIWVKSGDNHNPNDPQPPAPFDNRGAGEYFENPNAVCKGDEKCEGPAEIHAEAVGGSSPFIDVNWTAVDGAEQYDLYRAEEGGSFEHLATLDENTTEHRDTAIVVDETYRYRVTATIEGMETEACDEAEVTAIPTFPSVFAIAAAGITGLAAYTGYRRFGVS